MATSKTSNARASSSTQAAGISTSHVFMHHLHHSTRALTQCRDLIVEISFWLRDFFLDEHLKQHSLHTASRPMSSAKDYALEIITNANQSSARYIVRKQPSFFVRHLRLPLACVLLAFVIPQGLRALESLLENGWPSILEQIYQITQILPSELPSRLKSNASNLPLVVAILAIVLLLSLEEASDTLMVIEDMGVQISSKSRWKFLNIGRHGKFLPISEIIDIVIHEGFHGYGQVIYYMCVLTRDTGIEGNGVQVIFPNFLPRKEILLQVWKLSRQMLYGNTRRHYRHVPGQGLREVQHLHE